MKDYVDVSTVSHFATYASSRNSFIIGSTEPQIGWGMGSFVNHTNDSKNANCELVEEQSIVIYPISRQNKCNMFRMWIKTTREIKRGEELFIHYGKGLSQEFEYLDAKRSKPVVERLEALANILSTHTPLTDHKINIMVGYPVSIVQQTKQRMRQFIEDIKMPFQILDLHLPVNSILGMFLEKVKIGRRPETIASVLQQKTDGFTRLRSGIMTVVQNSGGRILYECGSRWYQQMQENSSFVQINDIVKEYMKMMNCADRIPKWYILEVRPGARHQRITNLNSEPCALTCIVPLSQIIDQPGIEILNVSVEVFGAIISVRGNQMFMDSANDQSKSRIYLYATTV